MLKELINHKISITQFLKNSKLEDNQLYYKNNLVDHNEAADYVFKTNSLAKYPIFNTNSILAYSLAAGWLIIPIENDQLNLIKAKSIKSLLKTQTQGNNKTLKEEYLLEYIARLTNYIEALSTQNCTEETISLICKEYDYLKISTINELLEHIKNELSKFQNLYEYYKSHSFDFLSSPSPSSSSLAI